MRKPEQIVKNLNLSEVHADADFNCRGKILPIDVHELATDIKERGLIQPVVVYPYPEDKVQETGYKYKLIAGFRRHMAHRVIEAKTIMCIVRPDMVNETEARLLNLTENTQRCDLTILQEARALSGLRNLGVGEFEIAERLGKSRGWVQIRCILLKLPEQVQLEAEAGVITQTQIRELYTIFLREGEDSLFKAVKRVKMTKERGRKPITLNPNKTSVYVKCHRSRAEIFQMIQRMLDNDMTGLPTRALAWAAGQISTEELFKDMEEYAEEHDTIFIAPATL